VHDLISVSHNAFQIVMDRETKCERSARVSADVTDVIVTSFKNAEAKGNSAIHKIWIQDFEAVIFRSLAALQTDAERVSAAEQVLCGKNSVSKESFQLAVAAAEAIFISFVFPYIHRNVSLVLLICDRRDVWFNIIKKSEPINTIEAFAELGYAQQI